ncbi:methyltransferase domain-containing protein [Chroococcidiopsis sp. FACHB-1243]|uniref:class I SAM-dependent methyltransferase n=1 Tax=Chroococcidiopsis sp. [FACHB-1243] TaxID=2692781 RepID=UPI001786A5AD|nr:class I SAM-dependent methyltransferase [Chroococcidiopsis sp. [FACHB-1243]]MBD2307300.1 methyltransferase domain-containing protein [Chroococcidiopsis sp. [FACHB-1243]]
MDKNHNKYIPALKYDWLTPVYDPLLKWTMGEFAFKRQLVRQAGIEKGNRVLDLGCGTATLTLLLKKSHPEAEVVGLDGDPKVLEIAKTKAVKTGLKIALDRGMAFELPYPDRSFDRVLSSLVFHHLTRDNKVRTLKEVFRVLKPGGELHVADWGKPQNTLMRVAFLLVQMLDGFNTTADSVNGLLPELFSQAGFEDIQQTDRHMTLFGTLALYRARKTK